MNWNMLNKHQKFDFIFDYLSTEETVDDLIDYVFEQILVNDLADTWYDKDIKINNKLWDDHSHDEKVALVYNEIKEDWDKDLLIEFLLDHMAIDQIENFAVIYNKQYA